MILFNFSFVRYICHPPKDMQTVIPSKLFEALAMGKPVLHGVDGESREIVEKNNVCYSLNLRMLTIYMKIY